MNNNNSKNRFCFCNIENWFNREKYKQLLRNIIRLDTLCKTKLFITKYTDLN